ncbi:MAG: endolytic transglycosylase MltG [Candidatus Zixiibacteriota bacterium]|nr:MAG: endolytic transglycosylase MltG [candidate division Zixibacteria bacterium]
MSKWKKYLSVALTLFVAVWIFYFATFHISHPAADFKEGTRYLIVRRGQSLSDIAANLEKMGAISSKSKFIFYSKLLGKTTRMKTGRYAIRPDDSIADIIDIIVRGYATPFNVTIPEGYTMAEIASLLHSTIDMDINGFKKLLSDPDLLDSLGIEAGNLEGYLAPSTYNFFYEEPPRSVVAKMTDNFFSSLPDSFEIKANGLGLTFHEAVTLASMVEAEAMIDSERSIIAAVYLNRLKKRWRLECDPTVIYALGGLDRPLYRKDLKYDSPYNTYRYFGLPPGPISNPGIRSLEAAVSPAKTEYMFFVARGDGSHVFTRSLREHINAKNKIKRQNRSG